MNWWEDPDERRNRKSTWADWLFALVIALSVLALTIAAWMATNPTPGK